MVIASDRTNDLMGNSGSDPDMLRASADNLMAFNRRLQDLQKAAASSLRATLEKVSKIASLVSEVNGANKKLLQVYAERDLLSYDVSRAYRSFQGLKLSPKAFERVVEKRALERLIKKTRIVKGEPPIKSQEKLVAYTKKLMSQFEDNVAREQVYLSKYIQAKIELAELLTSENVLAKVYFQQWEDAQKDVALGRTWKKMKKENVEVKMKKPEKEERQRASPGDFTVLTNSACHHPYCNKCTSTWGKESYDSDIYDSNQSLFRRPRKARVRRAG